MLGGNHYRKGHLDMQLLGIAWNKKPNNQNVRRTRSEANRLESRPGKEQRINAERFEDYKSAQHGYRGKS